jgi:hypothetical protein
VAGAVRQSSREQHHRAERLASRHIFLDTQVYRALNHNPANRALALLKEQVNSHRVVLHTTDITLLEVRRQIRERVLARQRELVVIERDLAGWRKSAPNVAPTNAIELDAEALSTELFRQFEWFLRHECKAEAHRALAVAPAAVFETYFDRKPPFDGEVSKEFPDAFVIEALRQWCQGQGDQMHVVTQDKAMTRAVSGDEHLIALSDIHEVLARAAADLGDDGEAAAEAVLGTPVFAGSLEAALRPQIAEMGYAYVGDLVEGEAYEGELLSIEEIGDWWVIGLNDRCVTLILYTKLKVRVEVQYEDLDHAFYDREDDRWFGAETASTKVDDEIDVEILVDVDRKIGTVREAKVLTQEVSITGPSDW